MCDRGGDQDRWRLLQHGAWRRASVSFRCGPPCGSRHRSPRPGHLQDLANGIEVFLMVAQRFSGKPQNFGLSCRPANALRKGGRCRLETLPRSCRPRRARSGWYGLPMCGQPCSWGSVGFQSAGQTTPAATDGPSESWDQRTFHYRFGFRKMFAFRSPSLWRKELLTAKASKDSLRARRENLKSPRRRDRGHGVHGAKTTRPQGGSAHECRNRPPCPR
jgi:hypothetical protein